MIKIVLLPLTDLSLPQSLCMWSFQKITCEWIKVGGVVPMFKCTHAYAKTRFFIIIIIRTIDTGALYRGISLPSSLCSACAGKLLWSVNVFFSSFNVHPFQLKETLLFCCHHLHSRRLYMKFFISCFFFLLILPSFSLHFFFFC